MDLFPEDFLDIIKAELFFDFFKYLGIAFFLFGFLGLFPFAQQGRRYELEILFEGFVDTPKSLPVGDHKQG